MTADWEEFIKRFTKIDKSDFVNLQSCKKPMDLALWVLCITKDRLDQKKLTADQIASILVNAEEISIDSNSITNALKRASNKVHRHYEDGTTYYEIMKPGRDHLLALEKPDLIDVFYFEPDTRYTSKRLLKNQIFNDLRGTIKIVDPYCGDRTLDLLLDLKDRPARILTRLENMKDRDKNKFVREVTDFKTENPTIELRSYPNTDLHDRYLISDDKVILIGHSIKDLGKKESFAVVLDRVNYSEIYEALSSNFKSRWDVSSVI